MQSGNQQALSEPARPTQKIVFARIDKLMHKGRLVDIDAAERTNLYKALYSDGIYNICHNCLFSDYRKLVVGASYRNSKAENEIAYDESSINNLAIFANNMWEFAPTWTLNTGARWDKHSKAGSKTTLSAGLNKKFDENSHAYVNWGQVFKAPTIDDLYYYTSDIYDGVTYVSKGNSNLNPEKGDTFTVGYGTKLNDKTEL